MLGITSTNKKAKIQLSNWKLCLELQGLVGGGINANSCWEKHAALEAIRLRIGLVCSNCVHKAVPERVGNEVPSSPPTPKTIIIVEGVALHSLTVASQVPQRVGQ